MSLQLGGVIDAVIVSACLAAITIELSGTIVETFWVGTSCLLSQTVIMPVFGTASEIFGRSQAMLTALSLFLLTPVSYVLRRLRHGA